ncbi:MAG: glycerol-3-phosphate dehydrogenase [Pseudomonadota bacterium]
MQFVKQALYDVAIIGGGINGTGVARDAAGRGLKVYLCDKADLGGATSSASTKLIHGGLRYLEHYEFRLVRESLLEREVLLKAAPHIIWPLEFILPHSKDMRPSWMVRMGLFLYDNLGARETLGNSRRLSLRDEAVGAPLNENFRTAFSYFDCWVQDNRLVILNAQDAASRGATIRPRTACRRAERNGDVWDLALETPNGTETAKARAVINAAGPWVNITGDTIDSTRSSDVIRHVKGSHIVTKRLFDHDCAYLFQNPDKRVVFAIPYEKDFTLIGTTDVDYDGDLGAPQASPEEIDYLCEAVSRYFAKPVTSKDVVWSYAGVRPLHGDEDENASSVSRDYKIRLDQPDGKAPLLTIYGGKLTTFRKLAGHVTDRLLRALDIEGEEWTETAVLPGGDFPGADFDAALRSFQSHHPWLPEELAWRLVRNYGTAAEQIIGDATSLTQLGRHFGADVYEAEIAHVIEHEWVREGADFLWRRSKRGLVLTDEQRADIDDWVAQHVPETLIEQNLEIVTAGETSRQSTRSAD